MTEENIDRSGMADELDEEEKKLFSGDGETPPTEEPAVEKSVETSVVETKVEEKPAEQQEPEDNDGEEVTEVNGGRFIRHGAFHRQREIAKAEKARREALEKEITEFREKSAAERARIDERLRILMQAGQQPLPGQPGQEQPQVPNPEEDPFAYMRYLEERLNSLGESTQGVQQHIQHQDQYTAAKTAFIQDASAFSQKEPDFMAAYTHLMNSRNRELELIGRTDPRERQQIIAQEEYQIVSEAIRQQRSPSELFYALAKDRGYRKPEPSAPAAPAPAADVKPSAVDQVKAVAAAQQSAKSLSSASGGAAPVITAESLAAMSEAEFDAIYSKMSREQRRAYFGG